MISEPIICLAQHISYTSLTLSPNGTKTRFHMTNVTKEIHRVHPKQFSSLWYVRRKPCTYLPSRLALSPNRPNRTSTLALSASSTIGSVQNDFWAFGTFGANPAPVWHFVQTDWNKIPHDPHHLGVLSGVQNNFWACGMFGANSAPILRRD
jgi:hypothetical protein